MLRDVIKQIIKAEILKAQKTGLLKKSFELEDLSPEALAKEGKTELPKIEIEQPEGEIFGDYCTNIAMKMAKVFKKSSMEIALILVNQLVDSSAGRKIFAKVEAKEPGFINFVLSEDCLKNQLKEILNAKQRFGQLNIGKRKRVQVEFISANPTGPLTLGNGRGAFLGDVLANILKKAGYCVEREYYINDVGEQVLALGHSVLGDEKAVYQGDYIDDLRQRIKEKEPQVVGEKAAQVILKKMIKPFVEKKLKIKFDCWFSEKSLYCSGQVEKAINELRIKNSTYEKDGALWFKSTLYGDDKDRVLIKSPKKEGEAVGEKTYLASDIAYLKNKFKRGFKKLIYIWGADHFGYIARMKAAAQSLGYSSEDIQFIIVQLVRLVEAGEEVKMSKRKGVFVLLEDLIDEVGLDASRFFFLTRSADSHLIFDLALAKEQSPKNPVYYIQYAYVRAIGIRRRAKNYKLKNINYKLLNHRAELSLIKNLIRFPEILEDIAKNYQIQRLPQYASELVASFHKFYEDCRVISKDKNLTQARLALVEGTRMVLKNVLDLMGISAPEKM